MSRTKGSLNKTPSKKDLYEKLHEGLTDRNVSNVVPEEGKALPPSFGRIDALVIAPKTIANNPIELLKLNKGFVGICNLRNSTSIANTPLRLYAIKNSKSEKIVFPYKSLNKVEVDNIKINTKSIKVKQAADIVEITDHPLFSVLNNVNDGDLNYFDGIELTSAYLGMIGNAYWKIEKNKGLPTGIRVLPAEYTAVTLTDDMKVKGYRLFNGIYQEEFAQEDVIHFKNVAPGLFWRVYNNALITGLYGQGDCEYCLDEIYLYNSINDFLRALTENNSIPSAIIKYSGGRLDKNTMEDVQHQWDKVLRTWKRAGKTKVMDQDFDWVPISLPPRDLDFAEGRKWLRGVIANCFGVPEELLASENANRASANVAISNYFRFTIKPKLKRLEERLNSHLVTLFDDNLFFEFDNPLPNDESLEIRKEWQDLQMGVMTINEIREGRGLAKVKWGDEPYAPAKETIKTTPDTQGIQDVTSDGKKPNSNPDGVNEERQNV